MADPVYGKNVIIEMLVDITYYPILCATDCTFSRIPEIITKTGPNSGLFREKALRIEDWNMSVSGLTKIENGVTLTFFYLIQTAVRRVEHTLRITFEDDTGADKQIAGSVLIGQMDINGPVSDFSNCTINFEGTGPFTVGAVTDPVGSATNVFADYWDFPVGNTFIDGASVEQSYSLEACTVLGVFREGTEYDLTTSAPVNRQCKHNNTTGVISFDTNIPSNGEKVWVIFKTS